MKLQLTIPIASLLLLSGCSTLRQTQKTVNEPTVSAPSSEREPIILYPEGNEGNERRLPIVVKDKPIKPNAPKDFTQTQPKPTKSIHFSEPETRDVRIRYNALSENVIHIDLDNLRKSFCYPYDGKVISMYGARGRSMHTGVDIKAVPNDTIRAAFSGTVRLSKPYSGYGNVIVIRHDTGLETVYSHNAKNLVSVNDVVVAGTPIALAGRTGRATTEHLHFETRINGEHFNPNLMLDYDNRTLCSGTLRIERRGDRIYASSGKSTKGSEPEEALQQTLYADIKPTVESSPSSTPANSARPSTTTASTKSIVHVIVKGDTLYSLARRYDTTVAEICKLNGISKNAILSLGQKIKVR